ncbi:MAG: hypothetical protein JSR90_23005 [Proteobacteria bacterium]|nr:hypothetical protein [Pseudomonadota bacterium]
MHNFLFRCPTTGLMVQGTVERIDPETSFVAQECPACGGIHLVDPRTGERPGEASKDQADDEM